MQPYPSLVPSGTVEEPAEEEVDPLGTDPLQVQLRELIESQHECILALVQSHRNVRDEIVIEIVKLKATFPEVVGDMEMELKTLEVAQGEELTDMMYQHIVQRRVVVQTITLNRLKVIIDNLAPF